MADDAKNSAGGAVKENITSCRVCGSEESLKRCANCKRVYYCSRQHQTEDWREHKPLCKYNMAAQVSTGKDANTKVSSATAQTTGDKLGNQQGGKEAATDTFDNSHFDARPFKPCEFEKPESYDPPALSKHVAKFLADDGFCVVDGILDEGELDDVISEVKKLDRDGRLTTGKLAGGRASGDNDQKVVNLDIRNDRMMWLQGDEKDVSCPATYEMLTEKMDLIVGGLNAHVKKHNLKGRTKAMIACYPGGGAGYKKHVDNPVKDGRLVTCICYLNKDWDSEKNGGYLRIFPQSKPDDYVDVSPVANRMLFFWSDGRNPHEVHPAFKSRYAVTVWFFDEAERTQAKLDEVERQLASVHDRIKSMDERKDELEKITMELEQQNQARKALASLSEEEKEVIIELIQVAPDPKTMLADMGIAQAIIEPLVAEAKRKQKIQELENEK